MHPLSILDKENEFFQARKEENILVIREKPRFAEQVNDLRNIHQFSSYFELVDMTTEVKAVVTLGSPTKAGARESVDFLQAVVESRREDYLLLRLFNLVNNYVATLSGLDKLTVHADQGRISVFHLSLSLAYDYRIVAEDAVFENAFSDLGMVPKGGAGYFISRMLGARKATEVLQWSRFSAEEALHLGLVDRLVPADSLESETLELARTHLKRPVSTLFGIRKLLKSDANELARSLALEDLIIQTRINAPDFPASLAEYMASRYPDTDTRPKAPAAC